MLVMTCTVVSAFVSWCVVDNNVHRMSDIQFKTVVCWPQHAVSVNSNPCTGLGRPWGFQEVETPRFQDSRHKKVVRLSVLRAGRLYPPGNIPGTHFC